MREYVLFMLGYSFTGVAIRTQRRMLQCSMLAKDGEWVESRESLCTVNSAAVRFRVDRRRGERRTTVMN
jgi:hypothetical protein